MGIKTVAIYSEADSRSMHVRMADEAFCIGGPKSADSYLRMDRILDVALKTGSQGIHPGYGFLSENAKFADMVESHGIAFIGPSSKPMNLMGDKINSKKIAMEAKCYTIPGYEGEVTDETMCATLANDIGYPVMIKASAGGGGKGMRVAYNESEVHEAFKICKNEAMSSFGDDRMLIERFIEDPHHIEIQVMADAYGNVAAFPERYVLPPSSLFPPAILINITLYNYCLPSPPPPPYPQQRVLGAAPKPEGPGGGPILSHRPRDTRQDARPSHSPLQGKGTPLLQ